LEYRTHGFRRSSLCAHVVFLGDQEIYRELIPSAQKHAKKHGGQVQQLFAKNV
jgi:hypothetical protein